MADKPIDLTLIRNQRAAQSEDSVKEILEKTLKELKDFNWEQGVFILIRRDNGMFYTDMRFANCSTLESRGILVSALIEETADHIEGEE